MIYNVRYGFATNSSSTHSIIISNDKIKDTCPKDHFFGWEHFTLSKTSSKRAYLAAILYSHLAPIIGDEMAQDLARSWCHLSQDDEIGELDHQSVPALPKNWNGRGFNRQFFKEYKQFLLNSNVVILGGNDNDTENHPLSCHNSPFVLPLIYDQFDLDLVAKKDNANDYWVLFDRKEGTKIRMAFSETQPAPTKAFSPELVDLKITNYCGMACGFCYQNSTKEGKHADVSYIDSVIRCLSEHHVFEVAIGGGDPIAHPNFDGILRTCRYYGVVPNFTVSNLDWLDDPDKREKWLDFCGGIAYSVTSFYSVRELGFAINKYELPLHKFQVQIIEGVINEYHFDQILEECYYHNLTLTILGYKHTGRGKDFANKKRLHEFDWLSIVKKKVWHENKSIRIGVDTVIAEKYKEQFKNLGVNEIFFTTREGSFSCYIDAVKQQIGPSSYAPKQMTSFDDTEQFIQKFLSF